MANDTCSIDECDKPTLARGWCNKHYKRWRRHGSPHADVSRKRTNRPGEPTDPCVVCGTTGGYVAPNSTRPKRCRQACSDCYKQFYREGRLDELDRVRFDVQDFIDRLFAGEVQPDDSGCILWPWDASLDRDGYPKIRRGSYYGPASRVVLHELAGPPPSHVHVAAHAPHEVCGNRHCVNIDHLRWATPDENVEDMVPDGTVPKGERNPSAILSAADVKEVRRLYAAGWGTHRQLADRYGVNKSTVGRILRGQTWRHVGGDA